MKIEFLGTRGNIKIASELHRRHTVTIITYRGTRVAIDCGLDWLDHTNEIHPDAFVITHAHNDHVDGLKNGSPLPVYASAASWKRLDQFPIKERVVIQHQVPFRIGEIIFEAFFVQHSLIAPAVGYRITAGEKIIFCAHDLLKLKHKSKALADVCLYIGDGATINRPLVRRKDGKIFGHTTIRAQIGWCRKERVKRMIVTHCGSQIVRTQPAIIEQLVANYGALNNVNAMIAHDDMEITI